MGNYSFEKPGQSFYFTSKNKNTHPLREEVVEMIEKCIPHDYDIVFHRATKKDFFATREIVYEVQEAAENMYKITLYFKEPSPTALYCILLFLVAAALGYGVGQWFNEIAGGIAFLAIMIIAISSGIKTVSQELESTCTQIRNSVKEYEKAHLLNRE